MPDEIAPLTDEEIQIGLDVIIEHLARMRIDELKSEVACHGLRIKVVQGCIDQVDETLNRLSFVNRKDIRMSNKELKRRKNICEKSYIQLSHALDNAVRLNKMIDAWKKSVDQIVKRITNLLDKKELGIKTCNIHSEAERELRRITQIVISIQDGFSDDDCHKILKEVTKVAPPTS